jgi:hypothetical protein
MRPIRSALLAATLALAAPAVFAQQGQDDQWEVTMSMESDGMKMPAMTQKVCTKKGAREERMQMDKNCKITDSKTSGSKYTFKFVCQDDKSNYTGTGEMEDLGKDAYRGKMAASGTREGEKFDMKMDMSGKKLGNCTWEDPSKKVEQFKAQQNAMMAKECDKQIAELEPGAFFPTEGLPPEMMFCKDRRADFCTNVTKVSQTMRDKAGYEAAMNKYGDKLERATKACNVDLAVIRGPVCKSAVDSKDWQWLNRYCPVEAGALRKAHCAGRTYSTVEKQYADMCSQLGGLSYTATTRADPAKANSGASATEAKPADPAKKPSTTDKLKEGTDKLKKFLKF